MTITVVKRNRECRIDKNGKRLSVLSEELRGDLGLKNGTRNQVVVAGGGMGRAEI